MKVLGPECFDVVTGHRGGIAYVAITAEGARQIFEQTARVLMPVSGGEDVQFLLEGDDAGERLNVVTRGPLTIGARYLYRGHAWTVLHGQPGSGSPSRAVLQRDPVAASAGASGGAEAPELLAGEDMPARRAGAAGHSGTRGPAGGHAQAPQAETEEGRDMRASSTSRPLRPPGGSE